MQRLHIALYSTATRDNCKDFTALAYIFLSGVPPGGVSFPALGAFHHARWMGKRMYCLKMYNVQCISFSQTIPPYGELAEGSERRFLLCGYFAHFVHFRMRH